MKSNKLALFIFVFLILLIAGWFYWFQWRPADIRKSCHGIAVDKAVDLFKVKIESPPGEPTEADKIAVEQGMYLKDDYDSYYEKCLHKKGLT